MDVSSQWFGDLKVASHSFPNIKDLSWIKVDRGLEHIVWNEQSIVCGQFGLTSNQPAYLLNASSQTLENTYTHCVE